MEGLDWKVFAAAKRVVRGNGGEVLWERPDGAVPFIVARNDDATAAIAIDCAPDGVEFGRHRHPIYRAMFERAMTDYRNETGDIAENIRLDVMEFRYTDDMANTRWVEDVEPDTIQMHVGLVTALDGDEKNPGLAFDFEVGSEEYSIWYIDGEWRGNVISHGEWLKAENAEEIAMEYIIGWWRPISDIH